MCDVQDLKTSLNFISTDFEEKVKNISDNVTLVKKEISNTNLLKGNEALEKKFIFFLLQGKEIWRGNQN